MRRSYLFTSILIAVLFVCSATAALAQTGQLRGHVLFKQADGTTIKAANAQIDVYRTDLPGSYPTKTNKNGEFVFAGLPFVGTYIIAASAPNAAPYALKNVKVGRDIDYELILAPGDGHRFTDAEAKNAVKGAGTGDAPAAASGESATDKANREELLKKNEEISKSNEKATEINKVVNETSKARHTA